MRVARIVAFQLVFILGLFGFFSLAPSQHIFAATTNPVELKLPDNARFERFDFEQKGIEGWKTVDGQWSVEEMAGAPSGKRVLMLQPKGRTFNVIVAPGGPYSNVDVSVRFKPISGHEDASGGIVFRFSEGRYYIVRANALENNFRLYYYDQSRHQIATAKVTPPALGQWHTLRVVALGNLINAYLEGQLLLQHQDSRFSLGQVGLWTKTDSVTAFDDLEIKSSNVKEGNERSSR